MSQLPHLNDLLGYAASALVLITFSARSIVTLRIVAMASNLMFITYALAAQLPPVLLLHLLLLPLNAWRLAQDTRWQRPALRPAAREHTTTLRPDSTR